MRMLMMEALLITLTLVVGVMSAPPRLMSRDVDDGDMETQPDVHTAAGQMEYLRKHAWLGKDNPDKQVASLTEDEQMVEAISEFQRFAGLQMTGKMDDATVNKMAQPRCGMPDNVNMASLNKRKKRFALQGSRWDNNDISYRIHNSYYTPDLHRTQVDEILKDAFRTWSEVTPLTFTEKRSGAVDIDIQFRQGDHGDGNRFDGQGGTLAHAYFPEFGGDAHFDESESWTHGEHQGTNLLQVAVHEFGHSLGLGHSDVQSAIMAPFYAGYDPQLKLDDDDIYAIQQLYGKPSTGESTTTTRAPATRPTRPPPGSLPDICRDGTFDAITNSEDLRTGITRTYAFRGDKYVELDSQGIAPNYPRNIADDWYGLPSNLDAALHWPTSSEGTARTYFFKDDEFYKYETRNGKHKLLSGYPKQISSGFAGIPDNLDAAFVWSGNGKTYFIKGDKYYRYRRGHGLDQGYPKYLNVWEGLPARIDAAFEYLNGKTYFFNGANYYRFNDDTFTVDSGYPRLNSIWWLGCPEESGRQVAEVEETEMSKKETIFRDVKTVASGASAQMSAMSLAALVCLLVVPFIQTI